MQEHHKRDLLAAAILLPMLAALLVGGSEPVRDITPAVFWTVEAVCLAVITAGAFALRKITKSNH